MWKYLKLSPDPLPLLACLLAPASPLPLGLPPALMLDQQTAVLIRYGQNNIVFLCSVCCKCGGRCHLWRYWDQLKSWKHILVFHQKGIRAGGFTQPETILCSLTEENAVLGKKIALIHPFNILESVFPHILKQEGLGLSPGWPEWAILD